MNLSHIDSAGQAPAYYDSFGRSLLAGFSIFYPGIEQWMTEKVIPGLVVGTRRVIVERNGETVLAFAILKKELDERKICTLWVSPDQRGRGLGQRLLSGSIEWLECAKPVLTVPEEIFPQFKRLLAKNSFELRQRVDGYYRLGKSEYVYNGFLSGKLAGAILQ